MKVLIRLLMLALFATVIFIPRGMIPMWAYWSLFILLFFVLFLYYRIEYGVSLRAVSSLVQGKIRYSCFIAKVPPMSSEDLIRGRFIVTDDAFELYQKGSPARLVWSRSIDEVESIETAKVVGLRNGFHINLKDGNRDSFVVFRHEKIYAELIEALGWKAD